MWGYLTSTRGASCPGQVPRVPLTSQEPCLHPTGGVPRGAGQRSVGTGGAAGAWQVCRGGARGGGAVLGPAVYLSVLEIGYD